MQARNVLITGGSRGIGQAIAARHQKDGLKVYAPTRAELDLGDRSSVEDFIARNQDHQFDILINSAGINHIHRLNDLSLDDLNQMQAVNLLAPFLLIKMVTPGMMKKKWGRIVNIGSAYGSRSRIARGGYSMTKSALNSLTRTTALEFAEHNILCNSVSPGFVETDLTRKNNSPKQIEILRQQIPMKRLGNVAEIAEFVRFLTSESNTYITGQDIFIDGGFTAQ